MLVPGSGLVRGATLEVQAPSVIRLRYFVKVPFRARAGLSRRAVFVRDDHTCQYCGERAENVDHVVPRSRGGLHVWENVVAARRRRNSQKARTAPPRGGLPARREPRAPKETLDRDRRAASNLAGRRSRAWRPTPSPPEQPPALPDRPGRLRRQGRPWALPLLAGPGGPAGRELPGLPGGHGGAGHGAAGGRAPWSAPAGWPRRRSGRCRPDPPGPARLPATIDDVDVQRLGRLRGQPALGPGGPRFAELEATLGPLEDQARQAATGFVLRIALLGLAGGLRCWCSRADPAAAAALRPRRPDRDPAAAGAGPGHLRPGRLREPRYDGALEYAPALIGDVRTGLDRCAPCARRWSGSAATWTGVRRPGQPGRRPRRRRHRAGPAHLRPAPQPGRLRPGRAAGRPVRRPRWSIPATWAPGASRSRRWPPTSAASTCPTCSSRATTTTRTWSRPWPPTTTPGPLTAAGTEVAGIRFFGVADPTFTPARATRWRSSRSLRPAAWAWPTAEAWAPVADVLLVHDGRLATYARGHVATSSRATCTASAPRSSTAPAP